VEGEVAAGRAVLIEYGRGPNGDGKIDSVTFTGSGLLFVGRFVPAQRRFTHLQTLAGAGAAETPLPNSIRLPIALANTGIAAADDGKVVYVQAAAPAQVAVFDRNVDTGLLTYRGLRSFASDVERGEFLKAAQTQWAAGQAARRERFWRSQPTVGSTL
jgi:hypothetical protein